MAKKYDTNPLDADVLRRAEEVRSGSQTEKIFEAQTSSFEAHTRQFAAPPTAEMPTEPLLPRFDEQNINEPYNSVFNRSQSFASQTNEANISVSVAAQKLILPPTSRGVLGFGVPENIAMLLPYLPFTIGAIAAVIELLCVARTETRVRFHAAQGLALHLASWMISAILAALTGVMPFASMTGKIFTGIVTVYFIISLFRVWKGKPNHIEALDDVTDFLNGKIKPQSK